VLSKRRETNLTSNEAVFCKSVEFVERWGLLPDAFESQAQIGANISMDSGCISFPLGNGNSHCLIWFWFAAEQSAKEGVLLTINGKSLNRQTFNVTSSTGDRPSRKIILSSHRHLI
jgi:hypothetical protein